MLSYSWNEEKNNLLKQTRGVSFEDVIHAISANQLLTSIPHPNQSKYRAQYIYILIINQYTYAVPYIKIDNNIFLKTIYPTRKYHKKYKRSIHEQTNI